jgi:hypothetical protein
MNDLYLEYQTTLEESFYLIHDRDATDEELREIMEEKPFFTWANSVAYSFKP